MLSVLLALLPTASADEVTISSPAIGQFGTARVQGTARTPLGDVWVNGVPVTLHQLSPIADPNWKSWHVDVEDIPAGLDQFMSGMHTVRAELIDPASGMRMASDQVAFYDMREIGHREDPGTVRPGSASLRITDAGLEAAAELVQEMVAADIDRIEQLGDLRTEVHGTLPFSLCGSLGSFGISTDLLELGGHDFGLGASFDQFPLGGFQLCVDGVDLFLERDFAGITNPDGPMVELDAVPDAVDVALHLGSFGYGGGVSLNAELQADPLELERYGVTVEAGIDVVEFPIACSVQAGATGTDIDLQLEIEPDSEGAIDVEQVVDATNVVANGFTLDFGGVCSALDMTALETPVQTRLESGVEAVLNRTYYPLTDPMARGTVLESMLETMMSEIPMRAVMGYGPGSVSVDSVVTAVSEDDDGITILQSSLVEMNTPDPERSLVRPQQKMYLPDEHAPGIEPGTAYDMEATVAASLLSNVLYEAYAAGIFHDRMTLRNDLSDLGFDTDGLAQKALDAAFLSGLMPGVEVVIPKGVELEIQAGPGLAPIAVVEDPSTGNRDVHVSIFNYQLRLVERATGATWVTLMADLKMRAVLEFAPGGEVQLDLVTEDFQMDYIDPNGFIASMLTGPDQLLTAQLKDQIQDHLRELMEESLTGIPLRAVTLDDAFGTEKDLVLTPEFGWTQYQREALRVKADVQ